MYCTPLETWDALGATGSAAEDFDAVSSGETLSLSTGSNYLIGNAFPSSQNPELSSDQDVIVIDRSTGNVQSTSDYSVDLRDGEVTWSGSGGVDLKVRYKMAPVPNSITVDKIEEATDQIDNETNTTFNGLETVTETLDGRGKTVAHYPLSNHPIDSISKVEVNRADPGQTDDWQTLTAGRSNDYIENDIGFEFMTAEDAARDQPANVRVTYDYGYSNVPSEIRKLCRMKTAQIMFQDNIISEGIEGRDDFNPKTGAGFLSEIKDIVNRYRVETYGATE